MPDLINIDTNQKAADINVPILRQPKFMALLLAYLSPTLKLRNDISNNYLGNLSYSAYNSSTPYAVNDRVTSGRSSYECIQANTGAAVTDTNYWYKVSDDIIGLSERLNYNCQKMQLEFILNKRFNTISSIYPPYNSTTGNIYIVTNPSLPRIAWLGRNNAVSSYIKTKSSTKFNYHPKALSSLGSNNYTIWVPGGLITPLGGLSIYQQVIINEVNKYNAVGLTFDIAPY
ncbi:MAG TPA: hypothetical protein VNX01_13585 [Bacteroidia bacterium]|nr:hypothetical protein [Bacteroidia bacterium]